MQSEEEKPGKGEINPPYRSLQQRPRVLGGNYLRGPRLWGASRLQICERKKKCVAGIQQPESQAMLIAKRPPFTVPCSAAAALEAPLAEPTVIKVGKITNSK